MSFVDWFIASFLYCFPHSYRSFNYCNSISCRCFTILKALAKSNGNIIAIAFKSQKNFELPTRTQIQGAIMLYYPYNLQTILGNISIFVKLSLFASFLYQFFASFLMALPLKLSLILSLKGVSEKIMVTFR